MKPNVTKKYQHVLETLSEQKILEVLFRWPEKEFSLTDLAKEARVAKVHAARIVNKLCKLYVIKVEKLSKIWRISANRDLFFIRKKMLNNLNLLFFGTDIVEFLNEHFKNPKAIVLFGSFRTGEDISTSDIDIAIETDTKEYNIIRLNELADMEKFLGRKIQLHLFDRKIIDVHVFNNIANGIVLSGFLEVGI